MRWAPPPSSRQRRSLGRGLRNLSRPLRARLRLPGQVVRRLPAVIKILRETGGHHAIECFLATPASHSGAEDFLQVADEIVGHAHEPVVSRVALRGPHVHLLLAWGVGIATHGEL